MRNLVDEDDASEKFGKLLRMCQEMGMVIFVRDA